MDRRRFLALTAIATLPALPAPAANRAASSPSPFKNTGMWVKPDEETITVTVWPGGGVGTCVQSFNADLLCSGSPLTVRVGKA